MRRVSGREGRGGARWLATPWGMLIAIPAGRRAPSASPRRRISTGWWVSLDELSSRSVTVSSHSDFIAALRGLSRSGVLLAYRIELAWHRGQEEVRFSRSPAVINSAAMVPGDKPGFHPQLRERICD